MQTSEKATTNQANDKIEELKNKPPMISLPDVFKSRFKG